MGQFIVGFQGGEVVELNSGGLTMTVDSVVQGSENVICKWFSGDTLLQGTFHQGSLRRPPNPPPRPRSQRF